ncbi:MAG: DUF5666 domain-containing protein [Luteimonas sp.]
MSTRLATAIRLLRPCAVAHAALLLAVLTLSGCVTGDMGGYPQGGQSYPGSSYPDQQYPDQQYPANQLIGTVRGVEVNAGRLMLDARTSDYGGSSRVDVYFDQRTQLAYQGQVFPVGGLEAGDEVRVDATRSGGRLWARSIELLRNVRDGQGGYGSGGYNNGGNNNGGYNSGGNNSGGNNNGGYNSGGELRGEVGYVDTRARTIELARGAVGGNYGAAQRIRYDERTLVEYQSQHYRPENLQRGDIIRIQARQYGNELIAERIWVEADVNRR